MLLVFNAQQTAENKDVDILLGTLDKVLWTRSLNKHCTDCHKIFYYTAIVMFCGLLFRNSRLIAKYIRLLLWTKS